MTPTSSDNEDHLNLFREMTMNWGSASISAFLRSAFLLKDLDLPSNSEIELPSVHHYLDGHCMLTVNYLNTCLTHGLNT